MSRLHQNYIIRHAKISDWFSIYRLMHSFFFELSHKMLSYYIYDSTYNNNLLVLVDKGKVIGMVSCSYHENNTAYVDYLIIDSVKRGKGLAVGLLDEVYKQCAEYKVKELCVAVVKENKEAFRLYTKYGFEHKKNTTDKFIMSMGVSRADMNCKDYHSRHPGLLKKLIFKSIFIVIMSINKIRK